MSPSSLSQPERGMQSVLHIHDCNSSSNNKKHLFLYKFKMKVGERDLQSIFNVQLNQIIHPSMHIIFATTTLPSVCYSNTRQPPHHQELIPLSIIFDEYLMEISYRANHQSIITKSVVLWFVLFSIIINRDFTT